MGRAVEVYCCAVLPAFLFFFKPQLCRVLLCSPLTILAEVGVDHTLEQLLLCPRLHRSTGTLMTEAESASLGHSMDAQPLRPSFDAHARRHGFRER